MDVHNAHEMKNQSMSHKGSYQKLIVMAVLSFISMYILMYSMVNVFGNIFNNLNEFYMAGLMAAPMIVIELILMARMYPNKRLNTLIITLSVVAGLIFFLFVRQQVGISDRQFLRSMIPHHASAILMCQQAPLTDPEIKSLCQEIVSSQQQEIDQMKAILERLDQK